jgi:hypothetical protein
MIDAMGSPSQTEKNVYRMDKFVRSDVFFFYCWHDMETRKRQPLAAQQVELLMRRESGFPN